MTSTTNVSQVKLNIMTQQQYNNATKNPSELYMVTDAKIDYNTDIVNKPGPSYHPNIFDCKWADHILNDAQWLRADTFSWQSGAIYQAAYQHLVDDWNTYWADKDVEVAENWQSETIDGITIVYITAADGHKICYTDQESTINSLYNATGVAWYYILDTTNQQFKLPRTKFGFTGLRSVVGGYIEAGLPNITGGIGLSTTQMSSSGAFTNWQSGGAQGWDGWNSYGNRGFNFDASRSSSVYGNSDTVQPKATEMYLYFYVGEFIQTALENTAGLNTELFNGKADISVLNTKTAHVVTEFQAPTSGNGYMWYRKYADGWVEQGQSNVTVNEQSTVTKTLPITMSNTYYTALAQNNTLSTAGDAENGVGIERTSVTQIKLFTHYINPNTINVSWEVSGLAA